MTTHFTIRSILSATAISAAGALALFAPTGTASAANNVLSCDGTSRTSVIECCETLVRTNGSPMWLKREGKNCRTATIVCTTKTYGTTAVAARKVCKYIYVSSSDGSKKPGGDTPGGGKRGRNGTASTVGIAGGNP